MANDERLGPLGLSSLALPQDVRRKTGAVCAFLRARVRDAAGLSERLSSSQEGYGRIGPRQTRPWALGRGRFAAAAKAS